MSISRVLVANRGEIAVRVITACRELGFESVAAVSEADRDSLPARMADRAVCIGPPPPEESYLNIQAILAAARDTGADAVHPGYGFLAEAPELAAACAEGGVKFIGPRSETIRDMGNKLQARDLVGRLGVPVVPGSKKIGTAEEAAALASDLGFPVLMKAAAGGGGRGIKVVTALKDLPTAFGECAAEARGAFGDATLFIERYIANARHIEVQILGDASGTVVHVGERDCSLQRRYQKVIEEAPATSLADGLMAEIRQAAVTIARNIAFENAGTVEFIVDEDEARFYFLEMNTRLQVEHPVTEMITGLDLVKEQILIADGRPLSVSQSDIRTSGHAIECRITAEAPKHGFQPRPGEITIWRPPEGEDIRVDSHCHAGHVVTPYYDSLLAKLIVKGASRWQAVARMQAALDQFVVSGVETTIPFLRLLVCQLDYVKGSVNTAWLEDNLDGLGEGI
jgi:acetyl-CoA carboxylase biotin carboxylase subunit